MVGAPGGHTELSSMAIDGSGRIVGGGYTQASSYNQDITWTDWKPFIVLNNTDGTFAWGKLFPEAIYTVKNVGFAPDE